MIIKNVIHKGQNVDILLQRGHIVDISPNIDIESEETLDGCGYTAMPAFYNTHCHAAMTLLRGYADDMPLMEWLQGHIWPRESKLTTTDIQDGVRLACQEMIRSGTVGFVDMYMQQEAALPIVQESGMRAIMGVNFFDGMSDEEKERNMKLIHSGAGDDMVRLGVAPHAIYTVNGDTYKQLAKIAEECGLSFITHLSETTNEVEDCINEHGVSPVHYLDQLGVLSSNLIAAHCVHLSDEDIRILAERGVVVSHCPVSNLKLASGIAPIAKMIEAGVNVTLGTDGAASNNNLDMREEMKFASLLAKSGGNPTAMPAQAAIEMACEAGARAMGIKGGKVEVGYVADLLLVDMNYPCTTPCYNVDSNWVYAAQSSQIKTVVCNGKVLYSA